MVGHHELVAVRRVGDPAGREAPRVAHRRVEVDAVGRLGQVLALHREHPEPVAQRRVAHRRRVVRARAVDERLLTGWPAPPCSTTPPRIHGSPAAAGRGPLRVVADDEVVVGAVTAPAPLAVQPEREGADRERLEVVHEVAADEVGRVAEALAQQQPRRLEGAGGEHHVRGARTSCAVAGRGRGSATPVARRPDRSRMTSATWLSGRSSQRPVRSARRSERDRVALGVDRAAVAAAEPAVVARRPAVVGDGVHAGRRPVGVEAGLLGGRRREDGAEHVGPGRHRERARAPRRERVASPRRPRRQPLGLGVVRLELVVVERPVDDVGALDRARAPSAGGSRPRGSGGAWRRRGRRRRRRSTAGC